MKYNEKIEAIKLRQTGKSIKQIARDLSVSKASVSLWVRGVVLSSRQHSILAKHGHTSAAIEKRRQSRLSHELAKRDLVSSSAERTIEAIPSKTLKIIGTMLYWAEGRKRGNRIVSFSNSDPKMIKIIMRFFREVCQVPETKFRAQIHTYSHLNIKNSLDYWSYVSGIPTSQFYKTYAKPSVASKGKMDSLPNGTVDIVVCDTILFLTIMGWIEGVVKKLV